MVMVMFLIVEQEIVIEGNKIFMTFIETIIILLKMKWNVLKEKEREKKRSRKKF